MCWNSDDNGREAYYPAMKPSRPLFGMTLIMAALLVFALQDAMIKDLTARYPVIELLSLRILLVLVFVGLAAAMTTGRRAFITRHWLPMCLRGLLAFTAFYLYYVALSYLPLADAATVLMSAPLFVTLLSVPLLGERVGFARWLAVSIGFLAVVYMLDPGADLFTPVAALPLLSAVCYALMPIITRSIREDEGSITIIIYTTLSYAIACALFTALVFLFPATEDARGVWAALAQPWQWPTVVDGLSIATTSVLFTVGLYAITLAYRVADVSVLAPFEYTYLIWAVAIGYVAFGEVPASRTLIAGSVIAICGIVIAVREHGARASVRKLRIIRRQ